MRTVALTRIALLTARSKIAARYVPLLFVEDREEETSLAVVSTGRVGFNDNLPLRRDQLFVLSRCLSRRRQRIGVVEPRISKVPRNALDSPVYWLALRSLIEQCKDYY